MPKLSAQRRSKRPDAARLAKSKIVVVGHGANSRALLRAPFDMRSRLGKAYRATIDALRAHVGSDVTPPQVALIDQAARLRLLTQIAWSELQHSGAFRKGEIAPAFDAYRRAAADERAVLAILGVQRRPQPVPSLDEYLEQSEPTDG
jgi:hypothetical protein